MKPIEYYCSHYFDPSRAASLTIDDLLFVDYMYRDNARIGKISKAMKYWQEQLQEIQGKDNDTV